MLQTIRNAWKIADLRKKLLFTFAILLLYRLGNVIPVPFVNTDTMSRWFEGSTLQNSVLGLFNMMSGSAFSRATLFALSIQPYINASIIIQLLTIAIPALERLSKEGGEEGRKKIERITRYTTVGLGVLMGWAYWMMTKNSNIQSIQAGSGEILVDTGIIPAITVILSFTAGSALVMWLGEQITEFGIGNGISILLFAGIVSRGPRMISDMISGVQLWQGVKAGTVTADTLTAAGYTAEQAAARLNQALAPWMIPVIIIGMLALVVFIVYISNAERRLPVQYAKRVVGRKMYGGQSTHIPMKVNMSGVMPIIFAQSIASLPATIGAFMGWTVKSEGFGGGMMRLFDTSKAFYSILYFFLIVGFSYFYASMSFNPIEVSNNLKKNGGFIPGFRPGKPTADFITKVLNKITMFGALYLSVVAILPIITGNLFGYRSLAIGGTSIIIVVGVALETVKQMEAQMLMRHYKGFLE